MPKTAQVNLDPEKGQDFAPAERATAGARVYSFKVAPALRAEFERIVREAKDEGIAQAEWIARAARAFWQARRSQDPKAPTLYVSPLAPRAWIELGRMLEDLQNAFAEGAQERLDLGFYRTWAQDPANRLAKSHLLQEMAADPTGEPFLAWWREEVEPKTPSALPPPAGRSA